MSRSALAGAVSTQYERIRDEVLSGAFAPGTVLLETALSKRYDVSRTPVREALGLLAQEGLLERTRRGFLVRTRSAAEILSIYEARIALESASAALAAQRRNELDLLRLDEAMERRRVATDLAQAGAANERWHRALQAAAGNSTIDKILLQLSSQLSIYKPGFTVREHPGREIDEHAAITEAVRAGDAESARLAMIEHLEIGREARLRALLNDTV